MMNLVREGRKSELNQWIAAFAASSVMFGYGVDNGWWWAELQRRFVAGKLLQLGLTSLMVIGAIIGAIAADIFGRRKTLLFTSIFVIPRLVFMLVTTESGYWITLYVASVGWGVKSVVVPLYISEIASNHNRGNLMVMQLSVCFLGFFIRYAIFAITYYCNNNSNTQNWMIESIVNCVLVVIAMLFHVTTLWMYPETPQYLNWKKRYEESARSLAIFNRVPYVSPEQDSASLPTNTPIKNVTQEWRERIREILEFTNRRNLAIIFSLIAIRRVVGPEWNAGDLINLSRPEDRITYLISMLAFFTLALVVSVFVMFNIRLLGKKSSLLVIIFVCFCTAIIGVTSLTEYTWIVGTISSVQEIAHLIFIGVTLAYTGEFFPINIRAIAIAAIAAWEVVMRRAFGYIHGIIPARSLIELHFSISCVAFVIAFFFVIIFFPQTNKLPNSEVNIKNNEQRPRSAGFLSIVCSSVCSIVNHLFW